MQEKKDAISCRKDHGRSVLFHEVLQRAKEAGGMRLHRRKSGASSGGGLHVGSLYAYVRRYACRVRRSLFSSGLEREQRREIRIRRSNGAEQAVFSSSPIGRRRKKKRTNTNTRQRKPTRSLFNASYAENSTSFRQHTQMGTLANIAAAD